MSLRQFMLTLRRGWPLMLAGLLLGMVPGLLLAKTATASYTATSTAMVALPTAKSITELQAGDTLTEARARTYAQLAGSRVVTDKVAARLGLKSGADVTIIPSAEPQTAVITIMATSPDAKQAADFANYTIEELTKAVPAMDGGKNNLVTIKPMSQAEVPPAATTPQGFLYMTLGALVGLSLGFFLAYLWVMRRHGAAAAQPEPTTHGAHASKTRQEP